MRAVTSAAESRSTPVSTPITVIRRSSGWVPPRLAEFWEYRELLYFLGRREIKVRYAQTVLGGLWTVLQPMMFVLVFTLAFRKLGNVQTEGISYPAFVLAGLVIWMFFSRSVTYGASSLVANVDLLTKSSAPRLVIPVAVVVIGFVDIAVVFVLALIISALFGEYPSWQLVFAPLMIVLALVWTIAVALFLSALNVRYRDVRQSLPFLIQSFMFLSPVAYPLDRLGEPLRSVLSVNPLVGIIEAFRWAMFDTAPPTMYAVVAAVVVSLVVLAGSLVYFARVERSFADFA
jgi:lipopolysaccharide transport system permease protein